MMISSQGTGRFHLQNNYICSVVDMVRNGLFDFVWAKAHLVSEEINSPWKLIRKKRRRINKRAASIFCILLNRIYFKRALCELRI